ncbi:DNA internalization-related competence protein ComEC/Rec2 [Nitrogeniibacter mangrovi]|uniref:DNA internalization-related competence protein ComEC/Rec2 n=2 Tax=Nitrogeniibacter mangrovi TaxID=2016596 RepID=A0A6C1B2S0_9RHOO|nr:DNA internalization-related competence protein ComEC/Rec2 [Nitrogeniibacter mangrovi]
MRFLFRPDAGGRVPPVPERIRLAWYDDPAQPSAGPGRLEPGERLRLTVRLRQVSGLHNPGGFDYAGWALARDIGARGYVKAGARLPGRDGGAVDRMRMRIRRWIDTHADPTVAPLLVAMAVGDQSGIAASVWDVLRATGTAHLVAISGLHVSIVALLVGGALAQGWRRIPALALRCPARRAGVIAGCLAALGYGALAGFGIPVMRALIMLLVAAVALWRSQRPAAGRVLALAAALVLVIDPWAVLSAGFWLSFGAVAALVLGLSGRRGGDRRLWRLARAQLAIGLVTAPVLVVGFGQVSLVGALVNVLAIPVVGMAVVPLLLVAVVSRWVLLLKFASAIVGALMPVLTAAAQLPLATWQHAAPPGPLVLVALLGSTIAILPRGTPLRGVGILLMAPVVLWTPPAPAHGTFEARVIDVGQGLAVLVRTAHHVLLYDAGPSYYHGGDAGRSVIVPLMRHLGVRRLHRMVLSHDDADHVGGARSVLGALEVGSIDAGSGVHVRGRAVERCVAGQHWQWDGVRFTWLHPDTGAAWHSDNNRSCVLRIGSVAGSLLLTGDIEAPVEAHLQATGRWQPTEVVVAPHHGSKSSSSEALIDSVHAHDVVFSAGRTNPYGHPAPVVVERWHAAGARSWSTVDDGEVRIDADDGRLSLHAWTAEHRRYWHSDVADPRH